MSTSKVNEMIITQLTTRTKGLLLTAAALTFFYLFYITNPGLASPHSKPPAFRQVGSDSIDPAANATLGFEKIFVLSKQPSWRTRGLQAAAALTGLEVTIPPQPQNPAELVQAFLAIGSTDVRHPGQGSATAWLSHLDLIKYFIASGLETALIIEDDVDWDMTIKEQTQLMSTAVRKFTNVPDHDTHPYGMDWDVLWFGHCGGPYENETDTPRLIYRDPSVRDTKLYTGWMKDYVTTMPEGVRYVQRGAGLVCSFAYAINKKGAQNLLDWQSKGQDEGFDIRMRTGSMKHAINCITVFPELMHHYEPEANYLSEVRKGDGKGAAEVEDAEHKPGITANVPNSARCKALFNRACVAPPNGEHDFG